jgi:hypothetical protein
MAWATLIMIGLFAAALASYVVMLFELNPAPAGLAARSRGRRAGIASGSRREY